MDSNHAVFREKDTAISPPKKIREPGRKRGYFAPKKCGNREGNGVISPPNTREPGRKRGYFTPKNQGIGKETGLFHPQKTGKETGLFHPQKIREPGSVVDTLRTPNTGRSRVKSRWEEETFLQKCPAWFCSQPSLPFSGHWSTVQMAKRPRHKVKPLSICRG